MRISKMFCDGITISQGTPFCDGPGGLGQIGEFEVSTVCFYHYDQDLTDDRMQGNEITRYRYWEDCTFYQTPRHRIMSALTWSRTRSPPPSARLSWEPNKHNHLVFFHN